MELEERKELAFNRLRRRKLPYISLVTDYIRLKRDEDVKGALGLSSSFIPNPRMYLRDCTSRVSFNSGNDKAVASSTASSINYLLKNDDARIITSDERLVLHDGKETKRLDLRNIEDAQKFFEGKRILRIMISPEDKGAPLEKCVRDTMSYLEAKAGHKLYYVASLHTDTDHLHSHIVISREDGGSCSRRNPLVIDRSALIKGAREVMQRTISEDMGYLTENEYYEKFEKNVEKLGSARIDYRIEKARREIRKERDGAVKYSAVIDGMPLRLKEIARKRIDNLVSFGARDLGIRRDGDSLVFSNENWQEYLRAKDKSRVFSSVTQSAKVNVDNYIKESHLFTTYYGRVVDKKVVEADTGKVAFLVKGDDDGEFHYAERKMNWDKYDAIRKGDAVKVSSSSSTLVKTPRGYRKRENIFIVKLADESPLQNLKNAKNANYENANLQKDGKSSASTARDGDKQRSAGEERGVVL